MGRGEGHPLSQPSRSLGPPGMPPWATAVSPARLREAAVPSAGSPGWGRSHQTPVTPLPGLGTPWPWTIPVPGEGTHRKPSWDRNRCKGQRQTAPARGTFPKASAVTHPCKCLFHTWFRARGSPGQRRVAGTDRPWPQKGRGSPSIKHGSHPFPPDKEREPSATSRWPSHAGDKEPGWTETGDGGVARGGGQFGTPAFPLRHGPQCVVLGEEGQQDEEGLAASPAACHPRGWHPNLCGDG